MIIDHGSFELYIPDTPNAGFPPKTLYCRNEAGYDWYQIAHQKPKPTGRWFVMIHPDGTIAAVDTDPEMMWPLGHRLIEIDEEVTRDMVFRDGGFYAGV
jgi:hypothetical protein